MTHAPWGLICRGFMWWVQGGKLWRDCFLSWDFGNVDYRLYTHHAVDTEHWYLWTAWTMQVRMEATEVYDGSAPEIHSKVRNSGDVVLRWDTNLVDPDEWTKYVNIKYKQSKLNHVLGWHILTEAPCGCCVLYWLYNIFNHCAPPPSFSFICLTDTFKQNDHTSEVLKTSGEGLFKLQFLNAINY